ncbi:MAG: acylphosphatase [Anaerolineales bacterium]|nr:acylphosphatase [Anaerolineales bacterium]
MTQNAAVVATVYGMVQGVGFRFYVRRIARELGLNGYVRNAPNGVAVQVRAEGERDKLDQLLKLLQIGPRSSRVDRLASEWLEYKNAFSGFAIRF